MSAEEARADVSSEEPRSVFVQAYREVVRTRGAHAAIESADGARVTHAELWARSGSLADALRARGLGRDDVVALSMGRSSALVIGMLGAWRAGAAWVVVEPSLPEARRARLVAIAGARVEVVEGQVRSVRDGDGDGDGVGDADGDGVGDADGDGDGSLAYVAFTSGSSGDPKGVRVEHRGLVPMLRAQIDGFGLDAATRALWVLSPSFDASVSDVGTVLLAGGTLLIDAPDVLADPRRLLEVLARREVTSIDLPPSVLARLAIDRLPTSLRTIVIGGEVADVDAVRRAAARVRVVNVYGPTEATVCTSLERCDPAWRGATLGAPLPGVRYRVVEGELWIGGACLARDYAGDAPRTAARFVWRDGARWYRTGDRVRHEGDAWIFEGRLDRQVKLAGKRAEPEEVEHALRAFGVEAAVLPRERGGRTILVAFLGKAGTETVSDTVSDTVVCRADHPLASRLRERLPEWLVPAGWVELPSLPRTAHGKLDLATLARLVLVHPRASWPDDPFQRRLAELFASVLGLESVDAHADFFALGGDSLALLTLLARAESEGLALSASQVHAAPRVRELAGMLEHARDPERRIFAELDAHARARLRPERWPSSVFPAARPAAVARDTLVLTGATGFLGARLRRALRACGHRVVALVRAPTDEAAQRRVGDDAQALAADVSASRFRLAPRVYEALAARTRCVVHLAARVSLAASYETLAPTNVDGALHALAFAHLAGAPIVHASTLSVFVASDREDVIFREDDDATADCTIAGGYAQTKWVAEQCVRRAPVPSTIVRYGLLTPDTARFEAPSGDWLVRFVREVATRGECPRALLEGELGFDATPVDHAVEATIRLVERASERASDRASDLRDTSRTFHVAGERPVSARRLIDAMRAEGVRVALVDGLSSDATGLLGAARAHAADRFKRHRALDLFAATGVRFDDAHARAEGIVAPAVDDDYLRGCVRAMLRP